MNEGGNTLDEAIGIITAANEVVNDPSSVGTALKTLTLRLRGSKTELEEMGEDVSDMATTTSQLQAKLLALTGGKVDIMLDENTFKSSTQILREMAEAWEDMSDISRASALELMGGKRQANVLSALITNFDTAEKAIEASANSAGSALRENEVYLDSIQGRIDLFNNAVQSMWKNTLDSDLVKDFVNLGTEIVKIIDKLGLFQSLLIALATYSMIKNKMGPIAFLGGISNIIRDTSKKVSTFISGLMSMSAATSAYTAETLSASVANQTLSATEAASIAAKNGLTLATTSLTASEASEMLTKAGVTKAEALSIVAKLGLTKETQVLTAATVQQAIADGTLTASQGAAAMAMFGASGAAKGLTASLKGLWTALWPILAVMAGVALIYGIVKGVDALITTTEELQEELKDLKAELADIQSDLKTVNSELETTQSRMAELLALPSLSFTEQEELDRLREQNEELERRERLLEAQEEREQKRVAEKATETVNSQLGAYEVEWWEVLGTALASGGAGAAAGAAIGSAIAPGIGTAIGVVAGTLIGAFGGGLGHSFSQGTVEENLNEEIESYEGLINKRAELEKKLTTASDEGTGLFGWGESEYDKTKRELEELEKEIGATETYIDGVLSELETTLNGVEYGYGADEALDKYYNALYKWEIEAGTIGAESDGLAHIFSRPEHKALKEGIDNYIASLKEGESASREEIEKIINNNDALAADIHAMGLELSDAVDYFTMKGSGFNNTPEGIMAQYQTTKQVLEDLKNQKINIDDLVEYDSDTNQATARVYKIAEHLKGVSSDIQEEFAKIIEDVKEGTLDYEKAFDKLDIYSMQAMVAYAKTQLETANKIAFPDLEISGWLDSVEELSGAFESLATSMDLVVRAQEQMDSSGRISLKTALDLMASTDEWNKILEVNNGVITMNANAEQILIQSKLDLIKANIEAAIADVETQITLMEGAINSQEAGNTFTEGFTNALVECQGIMVGLKAGWDAFWSGQDVGQAFNNARNAAIKNLKPTEQNLSGLYQQKAELEKKKEMLTGVDTTKEFKNNYDFDKTPGDKYGDDDATKAKTGWEKLVAKYENELALITNERDLIQAEIDKAEARGEKASAQYYEDLIRNSNEEKELLQEKHDALVAYLEENKNNIDPETWTEYNNEINETAVAIKECEVNTIEWADALREIDIHYFEQATDELSRLGEELDFVNSLLEDEEIADENGNWSDAGIARLGLYTQQMEKAAAEAKMYQDEIDKLNGQYENGELSEEQYQERLSELVSGQQDAIQSYEGAKDGIIELNEARIDAIKDGIEKEIEAYEDLIDLKKEELDAERDLYDFRKNVQKQSKDIATLERRIAALSGSTSASDIAERRKLEAELLDAREGLNDTYYERSQDQQSQALDEEAEAFSESKEKYIEELEATLDDVETLITNSIMDVMLNADTVLAQLNEISTTYGVDLSTTLTQPWVDASAQAIAWKNELQESMTSGEYAALIGEGGAITAFANGVATKLEGSWSTARNAAQGYVDFITGTELGNKFSSTLTGFGNQIQTIIDKWEGVKKAADDAYIAQTRKVEVGGNPNVGDTSGNGGDSGGGDQGGGLTDTKGNIIDTDTERLQAILNQFFGAKLDIDGQYGPKTTAAVKSMQAKIGDIQDGLYTAVTKEKLQAYLNKLNVSSWFSATGVYIPKALKTRASSSVGGGGGGSRLTTTVKYAKGTIGTSRDQWALTDELGDELVLVPGANGNLSFMRKGTSVVPADITANLVEWGKLNPDMLKVGGGANVNMISNAVIKPELNFEFDSLVHVDNCSQETLKDLEKMVDNKINQFSKQMNYAIKRIGGR